MFTDCVTSMSMCKESVSLFQLSEILVDWHGRGCTEYCIRNGTCLIICHFLNFKRGRRYKLAWKSLAHVIKGPNEFQ